MNNNLRMCACAVAMALVITGCDGANDSTAPNNTGGGNIGKAGSMARFGISSGHLYAIAGPDLNIFDIADAAQPVDVGAVPMTRDIETVFPYEDKLFIGSQSGMYIYDNQNPKRPKYLSQFLHMRSCDPVVVRDTLAFITQRSGSRCGGGTDQLDIVNIKDILYPRLIKSYKMTNPHGLGVDGNTLFLCDGSDGLKVYDITDPSDLFRTAKYQDINAYDVIPDRGNLLMIGSDGLYQYDYSKPGRPELLSTIAIGK